MKDNLIVSESFSDQGKHYFFDFREAVNGTYYIRISRSDYKGDDGYERTGVVIFQENFEFVMEALSSLFRSAGHELKQRQTEQPAKGIKAWEPETRPREKMMAEGRAAMSNAELLAMLIGSGTPNESAVALAERIMESINQDPWYLPHLTMENLRIFKGMGVAKSSTIIAVMELAVRIAATEPLDIWRKLSNN